MKFVTTMVVSMGVSAAIITPTAIAEPTSMEHVLVSMPMHKKSAETALPVTVLRGDALREAATSTLGDTLRATPGLSSASFGPGVGQPVIRGQQGPRVTVLQNGTSSADVSSLSADHANTVEPMLADSIEILRGPATLLYGGGAIGGVVNVLDNRIPDSVPETASGGIQYRRESAADMNVGVVRVDGGSGSTAWHFDGLYRDWHDLEVPGNPVLDNHPGEPVGADGHIPNTDGDTESATLGASRHFDDWFVGLAVNRMENNYGIPAGAHGHEEEADPFAEVEEGDISLEIEQTRYDAAIHWDRPLPPVELLRGYLTYTDYQHREIEGSGEIGTEFNNATWEGRLELVHEPIGPIHGVAGLQARSGDFSALGEEAFIPEVENAELGLFLLEDYHRGDWIFEAGLRLDFVERDPDTAAAQDQDFDAYSLSGSILWDFDRGWQLGLAISRAERAPSAEELYSNIEGTGPADWVVHAATDAIELGNPQLDTEVSQNADVSLRWLHSDLSVDVTVFYNQFTDYINLLNTGATVDETPVYSYYQEDAEFFGVELESEYLLAEMAGGQLAMGVFGDYIRGEFDAGGDVPRLPPTRLGGRLRWTADSWKLWTLVVSAQDQDKPGDNEESTSGYTRWDAGAEYILPVQDAEVLLSLELKNIADEEIRMSTSFLREVAPEGGRSVVASLRYSF